MLPPADMRAHEAYLLFVVRPGFKDAGTVEQLMLDKMYSHHARRSVKAAPAGSLFAFEGDVVTRAHVSSFTSGRVGYVVNTIEDSVVAGADPPGPLIARIKIEALQQVSCPAIGANKRR